MRDEKIDEFDALIVGSGVSGVLIAKRLGEANKRVLILEAGQGLPPDINDYMNRFFTATPKVPESPYPPELFHGSKLTDPTTVNAGRPTVLSLNPRGTFGDWQDPKQAISSRTARWPSAAHMSASMAARPGIGWGPACALCRPILR
jgi:glucose dehydrogenase